MTHLTRASWKLLLPLHALARDMPAEGLSASVVIKISGNAASMRGLNGVGGRKDITRLTPPQKYPAIARHNRLSLEQSPSLLPRSLSSSGLRLLFAVE